jgi:hypothetical protein
MKRCIQATDLSLYVYLIAKMLLHQYYQIFMYPFHYKIIFLWYTVEYNQKELKNENKRKSYS